MTEDQIKHMAQRFLMWKLPEHFAPDNGISFKPPFPEEPMRSRHWPVGTNLLDANQAEAMVRHMIEGLPQSDDPHGVKSFFRMFAKAEADPESPEAKAIIALAEKVERWECFRDPAYFDMWCVRRGGEREFKSGFHLLNGDEAVSLCALLNASVGTHPEGGDAKQAPCASMGDAVAEGETPNISHPTPSRA